MSGDGGAGEQVSGRGEAAGRSLREAGGRAELLWGSFRALLGFWGWQRGLALLFPSPCPSFPFLLLGPALPGPRPRARPLSAPPVLRSGRHTALGEITAASIGLAYFVVVCVFFNILITRIYHIFPFSKQRQSGFYTRFFNLVLT